MIFRRGQKGRKSNKLELRELGKLEMRKLKLQRAENEKYCDRKQNVEKRNSADKDGKPTYNSPNVCNKHLDLPKVTFISPLPAK